MLTLARKLSVYAVIAALAVGNGFTPRHAQAAPDHQFQAPLENVSLHATHGANHSADLVELPRCHDDAGQDRPSGFPANNCCVASCSAVAFIFASFAFDQLLPREIYSLPPGRVLTPATLIGDDPPPR
jgi:hypothetical protein